MLIFAEQHRQRGAHAHDQIGSQACRAILALPLQAQKSAKQGSQAQARDYGQKLHPRKHRKPPYSRLSGIKVRISLMDMQKSRLAWAEQPCSRMERAVFTMAG